METLYSPFSHLISTVTSISSFASYPYYASFGTFTISDNFLTHTNSDVEFSMMCTVKLNYFT